MMLKFTEYFRRAFLREAKANTHSTHIEDAIILNGKQGCDNALKALKDIARSIGDAKISKMITAKIDGSPAVFFGFLSNEFFVGTKSVFNKDPKFNFSDEDISRNHPGALGDVLKICLEHLPKICPQGKIFQGDLLYVRKTLKSQKIDGEDCWAWHPNTILYSAPKDSAIGRRVGASKMGIAVHTEYKQSGELSIALKGFGAKEEMFKPSKDVFLMDASHKSIGAAGKFSGSESDSFWKAWNEASSSAKKINWGAIDKKLIPDLMVFANAYIRKGIPYPSGEAMAAQFAGFLKEKGGLAAAKLKTPSKAAAAIAKADELAKEIALVAGPLANIFELFKKIQSMKNAIVKVLDRVGDLGMFFMKADGSLEYSGNEGYFIASGGASGMKLVDRFKFSSANFSADVIKGFER
jgi:hypothetical protein